MDKRIELIAQIAHEANRALSMDNGDGMTTSHWEDANDAQRMSIVAGVEFALRGGTPEQQHKAWCESKGSDGWEYAPVTDKQNKKHACLVPYEQLPDGQRMKDRLFISIVMAAHRELCAG